jgi:SsrA-binding protein
MKSELLFKNKRVFFDFNIFDKFEAGIMLVGSEVKSIRDRNISINGAFCVFVGSELFLKDTNISIYNDASYNNHDPKRDRKLLLHKKELRKLQEKVDEKGMTIVPIKMYLNEKGIFKVEIALAKGKNAVDKREYIKERESKKEINDLRII